jgi:hypothetical protein
VAREIQDYRHIAALAGEGCTSTATEEGSPELAAGGDCCEYIVSIVGEDDSDRDLAVVGAICGVEGAGPIVKAHFSAKSSA